jgi:hypothetical protein
MMWIPRLEELRPQMIFISAGFDAHREDDLGQLGLVEADYAWITRASWTVAGAMPGPHRVVPGRRLQPGRPGAQRGSACACAGVVARTGWLAALTVCKHGRAHPGSRWL